MHIATRHRRPLAALAATVGLLVTTPGVAEATEPADPGPVPGDVTMLTPAGDWTRFSGPYGFVYGLDFVYGDELFVIGNGSIEDVCGFGSPVAPSETGRLRQRNDRRWTLRDTVDEQLVFTTVYERTDDLTVFEWFATVCPAAFAGEPLPEPLASGMTDIYFDAVMDTPWWFTFETAAFPQPTGHYFNGTRGVMELADGGSAYLIAETRYSVTDAGLEVGREFISLTPRD
ncbi:MAG: hypothetical protein AAFP84_04305 [Actinomycetota bacterium]